jgi:hypothetical protein
MPEAHLSKHHHATIEKLFAHPVSRNVEWRQVRSLLEAVGAVSEHANGKLAVTIGPETEVLDPPHGKDIPVQMVIDLRRMLANAGLGPAGSAPARDQRSRDYGDSRWGEPGK